MKQIYEDLTDDIKKRLANVKLLVLDFDGTLTDNKVYVNQDGSEMVMADRGDGLGLEILRKYSDVKIIILSKETNPVTKARADKLKIPCTHGVQTKIDNFKIKIKKFNVNKDEVCFVGNDLNDIECIKEAGIGIAVNDAYPQVKENADYITSRNGGYGAVREICEFILYAKKAHPNP